MSAVFRGATLIREKAFSRGRRLFQCGYPKVRRLLEGGAYLRPGAYQRKYGKHVIFLLSVYIITSLIMYQSILLENQIRIIIIKKR